MLTRPAVARPLRLVLVGCLGGPLGCASASPAPVAPTVSVPIAAVARGGEAPVDGAPIAVDAATFRAGDEVEVEWRGRWWSAVVLERRDDGWLIHYDGYGDEWDEVVGPDRVRTRGLSDEPEPDP